MWNKNCPGFVSYHSLCDHVGAFLCFYMAVSCLSPHKDVISEKQNESERARERADIGTDIWLLGGSSRSHSSSCLTLTVLRGIQLLALVCVCSTKRCLSVWDFSVCSYPTSQSLAWKLHRYMTRASVKYLHDLTQALLTWLEASMPDILEHSACQHILNLKPWGG